MPEVDPALALAGLLVGVVVGLTGMGGGALLTPLLVLFFGVPPLTAVGSDLVVSLFLKPVGGLVHLRRGTVHRPVVRWLVLGSVPSALTGAVLLSALGDGDRVQDGLRLALGGALLLASGTIVAKAYLSVRARGRGTAGPRPPVVVRPVATVLVGVLGGLVVGLTSVGSGSLVVVLLLLLYPGMRSAEVVGTDLVQAVPLVAAAALGHLLLGDVELGLTASLVLGGVPGAYVGARLSTRAPQWFVRRALLLVLVASGLKLVGLSTTATGVVLAALVLLGPLAWGVARQRAGLPFRGAHERRGGLLTEALAQDADGRS